MKVKNLLAVAALCLFSGTASAQVTDYNSVYFQYNPSWITNYSLFSTFNNANNYVHGFTLGYAKSFGIAGDKVPLFLEVGGHLKYGLQTRSGDILGGGTYRETLNMLALNIPVNFGYSIRLGDNLALNPYVGARMRLNLVGLRTNKTTVGGNEVTKTYNLYSSSDDNMRDSEWTWNRFQIGVSAGVKMIISETFYVEAGYTYDFNRIGKMTTGLLEYNLNTSSVNLGFGYCF